MGVLRREGEERGVLLEESVEPGLSVPPTTTALEALPRGVPVVEGEGERVGERDTVVVREGELEAVGEAPALPLTLTLLVPVGDRVGEGVAVTVGEMLELGLLPARGEAVVLTAGEGLEEAPDALGEGEDETHTERDCAERVDVVEGVPSVDGVNTLLVEADGVLL